MILHHGQRFRNGSEFRKAVEVFVVCEGFKLCVMENRSHVVCCEYFDLRCDWAIQVGQVVNGTRFVIIEFKPELKCT